MAVLSIGRSLTLALVALVASCAAPPPPPEPTVAQVNITAMPNANPDPTGRPSPTVVHLYALQPGAPFEIGSYDALTGGEMGDLTETMERIARIVVPAGDSVERVFELPDGTSQLGITAAYRNVDTSVWRASRPVTPNTVNTLNATIGPNRVSLE